MPASRSPFGDEWRACLREQYKQAARQVNTSRHRAVAEVLRQAGFSDDELAALYLEATLHTDDLPEQMLPDIDALESYRQAQDAALHLDDCTCPRCQSTRKT